MIDPSSKLATVRSLDVQTSLSTLGELLGVEGAKSDELLQCSQYSELEKCLCSSQVNKFCHFGQRNFRLKVEGLNQFTNF